MQIHRRGSVIALALAGLLGSLTGPAPARVRAQSGQAAPFADQAVGFALSGPARDLPAAAPEEKDSNSFRKGREGEGGDAEEFRTTAPGVEADVDAALDNPVAQAPDLVFGAGPILSFDTLSNQDNFTAFGFRVSPPDTNMDVGPNHVVQTVNLLVRVYNKAGAPLTAPFKMSSLFAALGGICSTDDDGDPIVLYDPMADRWLISQFAFLGGGTIPPYHQCVAISKTGDPTGAYFLYDFVVPNNEFNDYPHIGVWPDAYYMTVNQFLNGGPFDGTGAYAFDRAKMLAGDPSAGFVYFNLNLATHPEGIGGALPSDFDGVNPPAAGAPNTFSYFLATEFGDALDALRLFDFHVDFAVPANSTFTERTESPIAVAAFNPLSPAGRADIRQPAPATDAHAVDSISDRLMHRLQYRNFGTHESLVTTHTVNTGTGTTLATYKAGVRYYELRRSGGTWAVHEQGTFSPDADNRWMGSAALDNGGNLAVGYSVSSLTTFPSIRYAGRLASDPPGGLAQGERSLVAGTGVQRSTGSRWGDYSMLAVDPSDECTFWYTTEYYTAASQLTSTVGWLTRIGSFKFDQCTPPPPRGTLQGAVTSCSTGLPLGNALVTTTNGFAASTSAGGTYSISLPADTYSVTASKAGYAPAAASGIVVASGSTTTQDFCLNPVPDLAFGSSAVSAGNGNGVIEFNECNALDVNIENVGAASASGISAMLSTSTPGVTVSQPNSPYPDIPAGGTGTNLVPFEVSTSPSFACGTVIDFTLGLTFAGGTDTVSFKMPTCTKTVNITGSLAAGDPQQTGRLNRFTPGGSCAAPEACPGLAATTGLRAYDVHAFTNSAPAAACVTVNVNTACTGPNFIFPVAYLGSFNSTNLCTNYLADTGGSPNPSGSMSLNLPAGATMQLVVHEVTPGAGCASYDVSVSGLGTDGGGECVPCTISCPADTVAPNDPGQCGAIVSYPPATLNGSCGVLTQTPPPGSFFSVGSTPVISSATAGQSCTRKVVVKDTQPPTITGATTSPAMLWPPNHAMVPVTVAYTSSDNCAGTCSLSVTSSQPVDGLGDGDTSPDWQVVDAHTVLLRAERSGKIKSGRTYTITIRCSDAAGNTTSRAVTVLVPHNR